MLINRDLESLAGYSREKGEYRSTGILEIMAYSGSYYLLMQQDTEI